MKKFLKQHFIPLTFFLLAVLIEYLAVYVTSGSFRISKPWLMLTLLAALTALQYLMPKNRSRHIFSSLALSVLAVANLVFVIIFDMTGTIFDFAMFNLRGDAMAILESIPLNFTYTASVGVLLSAFVAFGRAFDDGVPLPHNKIVYRSATVVLAAACFIYGGLSWSSVVQSRQQDVVQEQIYGDDKGGYTDMGVIGNFLTQLLEGLSWEVEVGDVDEISQFLYQETAPTDAMFGAAEGYNVVTVLSESMEWFSFLQDPDLYPFGHTASEETLRELYPNLYAFMDSSYVMTNFHGREKTDISENLSLLGNYPMHYYLNYDYPENNIVYSLPGVMKTLYGVDSYSFHNGTETFYNRGTYLPQAVGFKDFISSQDMEEMGMTNYVTDSQRNLDSDMIKTCADMMFPTDRRFNTYITTITLHGQYSHRDNLQKYYDTLDRYGLLPLTEGEEEDPEANAFRYYAAAAMELDAFVGEMMRELTERELLDNTLIVFFADHSAYYQSMSNYIKDIYPQTDPTGISEMYRIPMMIKVGDQKERVDVDKFCCTADILPTTLNLLGIRYYSNLYYGHSVFGEEESLLYSRAYDVFMTDKMYFTTLNHITWSDESVDEAYLDEIARRGEKLMTKVSYVNRLFAADFFRDAKLSEYEKNLRSLNGLS